VRATQSEYCVALRLGSQRRPPGRARPSHAFAFGIAQIPKAKGAPRHVGTVYCVSLRFVGTVPAVPTCLGAHSKGEGVRGPGPSGGPPLATKFEGYAVPTNLGATVLRLLLLGSADNIHTCIHTCIHTYIHTYTHIHTYIHIYIHTYQVTARESVRIGGYCVCVPRTNQKQRCVEPRVCDPQELRRRADRQEQRPGGQNHASSTWCGPHLPSPGSPAHVSTHPLGSRASMPPPQAQVRRVCPEASAFRLACISGT
jgi:hypothetical protein